jgi:tetratricopeptide (TPR) repeat protein
MKPFVYLAVFLGSAIAPGVSTIQDPANTRDPRVREAQGKIARIQSLAEKLQKKQTVDLQSLESEFATPPADAERTTRELRDEVLGLEEQWIAAQAARSQAVEKARSARGMEPEIVTVAEETPHPQAPAPGLELGMLYFRRKNFARAEAVLAGVAGSEALYFRARSLDSLNRVDEALAAYKKCKDDSPNDRRFLAAVERANRGLEWKAQFGKVEQFLEPLQRSRFSGFQSLQKPGEAGKQQKLGDAPTQQKPGEPKLQKTGGGTR